MQIESRRVPAWLWYALMGIFLWGLWGFLSKIGADSANPLQMQILFTLGMLWIINGITPVKVSESTEEAGLDEGIHGETAYAIEA